MAIDEIKVRTVELPVRGEIEKERGYGKDYLLTHRW
jgi:hypothetical protein